MKRINQFSLKDIVRKRAMNQLEQKYQSTDMKTQKIPGQDSGQQENQFSQNQILMNIIEESNKDVKLSTLNLSIEEKSNLIQYISKKVDISFNITKMIPKVKIKRVSRIQIILNSIEKQINKKQQSSTTAKKLENQSNSSLKSFFNSKKFSYFVLTGNIHVFEKDSQHSEDQKKRFYNEQISSQKIFFNWKQFQREFSDFKKTKTFSQFTGFGPVFSQKSNQHEVNLFLIQKQLNQRRSNTTKYSQLLIGEQSIFVQIQNPEFQDEYINRSGMDYQKMSQIIQNHQFFTSLGKKIKNYLQFFQLKQYKKNQEIYSIGDPIDKFYLIIKGQIVFENKKINPIKTSVSSVSSPNNSRKNSMHVHFTIKTQTLSSGNYFGQEQIVLEIKERMLNAKCKSSKCQILQISKERFDKMLQYSDFYDTAKRGAETKFQQRMTKLQKNKQIRTKFALKQYNENEQQQKDIRTQRPDQGKAETPLNRAKVSSKGQYKLMHGNVIRQFSKQQRRKMSQDVNFSMLKVNPDMYQKTMDKFRKYSIKPRQKYVPQINWQLKRVWKVLNLQNILRQQAQIGSPQGRKIYDSHKRYLHQINQSKSLRPKTSSSTHRTKIQYIAYLQQFKSESKN